MHLISLHASLSLALVHNIVGRCAHLVKRVQCCVHEVVVPSDLIQAVLASLDRRARIRVDAEPLLRVLGSDSVGEGLLRKCKARGRVARARSRASVVASHERLEGTVG
jgi:hypothetical protein